MKRLECNKNEHTVDNYLSIPNTIYMTTEISDLYQPEGKVRGPIVDGIFYPDDGKLLTEEIRYLLQEVAGIKGSSFGIIVPHAALPFSGSLAAAAYNSIAGRDISTVVIIAPVHREEQDKVFLTESESFIIPTGIIKVNTDMVKKLENADPCFQLNDLPHLEEHCIEMQLPFIHYLYPDADIVPILVGSGKKEILEIVSDALKTIFRDKLEKTLFVVSANMSAYLPVEEANGHCEQLLQVLESGNINDLNNMIKSNYKKFKEIGAAAVLLSIAGEGARVKVLRKKDSSKYSCENGNIVCYAAITVDKAG
ncbi:MAG: AmmeMemoRadiSam system protein B [Spirochaetia bacterium]|nr:AmmeMemoRadiSam system protein B [Spirochaetia bacterium]